MPAKPWQPPCIVSHIICRENHKGAMHHGLKITVFLLAIITVIGVRVPCTLTHRTPTHHAIWGGGN